MLRCGWWLVRGRRGGGVEEGAYDGLSGRGLGRYAVTPESGFRFSA